MVIYLDIKNLFDGFFYGLYPGIAKLHHFAGIRKYHMIVLSVKIGFLVLCLIFAKLVFAYKFAFHQEFYGIVEGGPTNPIVLVFHVDIERFYIKMLLAIIYL